jgi:hypothetical protein
MCKVIVFIRQNLTPIVTSAAILAMVAAMPACSSTGGSSTGGSESASSDPPKQVEANFDLSKCEQQGPGLYKCPAVDKPVCTPEFSQPSVQCIRIGKKGSVYVMTPEAP